MKAQTIEVERIYDYSFQPSSLKSIDTTSEGGYIVQLSQARLNFTYPGYNIKLDANGDTIWRELTGAKVTNVDRSICKNVNNKYLFASIYLKYSTNTDTGLFAFRKLSTNKDVIFSLLDNVGEKRTAIVTTSILINTPNDYWCFGWSANTSITIGQGGFWKYTIIRTDSMGNRTHTKVYYPGNIISGGRTCNLTKYGNGNVVMYGFNATPFSQKPYLLKINQQMDTIAGKTTYWSTNGDVFNPEYGNLIYAKSNHFYITGSWGGATYGNDRVGVQKLDTALNVIWTKKVGAFGCYSSRIFELANDTLLIVSPEHLSNRIWLYKLTKDGKLADSTFVTSTIGGLGELYGAVLKWDGTLAIASEALKNTTPTREKAYFAKIKLPYGTRPAGYTICSLYPAPISDFSYRYSNDSLYLASIVATLSGYKWEMCNITVTTKTAFCKILYPDSMEVSLTVTNALGCKARSTQKMQLPTNIAPEAEKVINQIQIYPNPTQGSLRMESAKTGTLRFFALHGQQVAIVEVSGNITFDLSHLPKGLYLYQFQSHEGIKHGKLVVE